MTASPDAPGTTQPTIAGTTTTSGAGPWSTTAGSTRSSASRVSSAGLSWLTILRKREAFRRAFAGFDPEAVAAFGERRRRAAARRRRHRATPRQDRGDHRQRARATLELRQSGGSLAALIWQYEPVRTCPPKKFSELPASTAESTALSKDLRKRGFRFVGPTTVYAAMQALGVVNDHLAGCASGAAADAERAALIRPQ